MWVFKKIVSRLFLPLPLCLEIMLLGLLLLWFSKRQKTGKVLVTFGAVLLGLLSSGFVGDPLLESLESTSPALQNPGEDGATIQWIAVLGAGYSADAKLPPSSRPGPATLAHLVEGARLQRLLPGSKLIVSAEYCGQPEEIAKTMTALALLFGVQENDLILAEGAKDTAEEVKLIGRTVGKEPFILVTSASHMPRAMALFQAQEMRPVAAPTYQLVREDPGHDPSIYFPSADHLRKSERAFYEYLGQAWANLSR